MVPRYLLDVLALAYTFTLSAVTRSGTVLMDGVVVELAWPCSASSVRVSADSAQ